MGTAESSISHTGKWGMVMGAGIRHLLIITCMAWSQRDWLPGRKTVSRILSNEKVTMQIARIRAQGFSFNSATPAARLARPSNATIT